jgi:hypothetical protein
MHVEFNSKSAADMYARYAESKYPDLSPTREATNATRVTAPGTKVTQPVAVSDAELKEKASAVAKKPLSSDKSFVQPSDASATEKAKGIEQIRKLRGEIPEQQQYNSVDEYLKKKNQPPVNINNFNNGGGGQKSSPPVASPIAYNDELLNWYMSKIA